MKKQILAGIVLLCPVVGFSADGLKPLDVKLGLWETSMTSQMSGLPPLPADVLAKLSPEQRTRMEAQMKARQAQGPQSKATKSCVTKESLSKAQMFGDQNNASCKRTITSSTPKMQVMHMECMTGQMKTTGDVHVEAVNSETVKGTSEMTSSDGTRSMDVKVSFASKWLAADCGDLKPK